MAPKPSIVVIPGSFSLPRFYDDTVDALKALGYEAEVHALPSSSRTSPEKPATMYEDADVFRAAAERLADQGKDVVLLTHSYGGVVGTEAAKGITKSAREATGKKGGVVQIVYLTSIVPRVGQSLKDMFGGEFPPFIIIDESGFMSHVVEESAKANFNDIPFEEACDIVRQMPNHSLPSFEGELTYAAYKDIPVSYILCEKDLTIPPPFQQGMIDMIKEATGSEVKVERLDSGHVPILKMPVETAEAVHKLILV